LFKSIKKYYFYVTFSIKALFFYINKIYSKYMSLVVRVVGLGGSGKSSLIRYLKEGRVNEDPGEPVP
jgi:ABC-type phosphate/phosphonate transport system ATPase subunit